jgi:hypothetical protein
MKEREIQKHQQKQQEICAQKEVLEAHNQETVDNIKKEQEKKEEKIHQMRENIEMIKAER